MASKVNKFVNPGNSTLFTVFALILIIGVPGFVAYADSSDDTYSSLISDEVLVDTAFVTSGGSNYTFGVTTVDADGSRTSVLDSVAADEVSNLSDLTSTTRVLLHTSEANLSAIPDKIVVDTDMTFDSLRIRFYSSSLLSGITDISLTYDSDEEVYSYELSSVEKAALDGYTSYAVYLGYSTAVTAESEYVYSVSMYSSETIFTDDVVEMIVLVGGILLLICGTFSLSFIDMNTPGKAFKAVGNKLKNNRRND